MCSFGCGPWDFGQVTQPHGATLNASDCSVVIKYWVVLTMLQKKHIASIRLCSKLDFNIPFFT